MKRFIFSLTLYLCCACAQAQQTPARLRFNATGELKIAQFTDMHLGHDENGNRVVADMIREVLDTEKPDVVVFTGDITVMDEVEPAWNEIGKELAARRIPWTAVLGNHDDEHAVKRRELINIISNAPYCLMRNIAEGIEGEGNHVIPVYTSEKGDKVAALLYCMDSRAYSTIPSLKGYGWFDHSQVEWYHRESAGYTAKNGGQPLPALAFFHIPLPEYVDAWTSFDTRRMGDRNEKECAPPLNSGMFLAMLECGDVMGTFVGHDHVNDYIATWQGIALAYGRASGGANTYGDKIPGSRIIVLKEDRRMFDTWIREKGNKQCLFTCSYPSFFQKEKK
jgi:3',5'-cyclic AMP phosphodiesterase CpdA